MVLTVGPDGLTGHPAHIDQHTVVPLIVAAFQAHRTQWEPYWSAHDDRTWHSVAGANHLVQA